MTESPDMPDLLGRLQDSFTRPTPAASPEGERPTCNVMWDIGMRCELPPHGDDTQHAMGIYVERIVPADQPEESGMTEAHVGWIEFVKPGKSTTHIAYAHEDGSVYLPEGPDVVTETDFRMAAATDRFWPLHPHCISPTAYAIQQAAAQPDEAAELVEKCRTAISDPGRFTPRDFGPLCEECKRHHAVNYEPLTHWQTRAVLSVLCPAIREQHGEQITREFTRGHFEVGSEVVGPQLRLCDSCGTRWPCPTARTAAEIADIARGQR